MIKLRPWLILLTMAFSLPSCGTLYSIDAQRQSIYRMQVQFRSYVDAKLVIEAFNTTSVPQPEPISTLDTGSPDCLFVIIGNIRGDSVLNATRQKILNSGLPIEKITIEHE